MDTGLLNLTEDEKQYIINRRNNRKSKTIYKVEEQLLIENIRTSLSLGICQDKYLQHIYDQNAILKQELAKKYEKEMSPWIWLTLRPEKISLNDFKKINTKMLSKKWIKTYLYVYEQTGKTEEEIGKGLHCHYLIYKGVKKQSDCIREIQNTVKNYIDVFNINSWRWCNINFIPEKFKNTKINYMLGKKRNTPKDPHKEIKQYYDRVYRDQNGLKEYYKTDDFEIPENIGSYNDLEAICDEDDDDI